MLRYREPVPITVAGHDGMPLRVWDYGGGGTPLIFAHCTGTLARIWDVVVDELDDAFRVIAVDTRGHGDSGAPKDREQCQWSYSGRDLLAVADHFGLAPGFGAVGHSAGGAHVAYAEYHRPGSVGKAMLIDAIIAERKRFEGENPLAIKVRHRINAFESLAIARERLVSKAPMALWVDGAVDAYMDHAFDVDESGACTLKCPGHREAWYYELGGASDVFDALHTLKSEILLLSGSKSYVQPMIAEQNTLLPNSRLEIIDGVGHFIPQERPKDVAALIKRHFQA